VVPREPDLEPRLRTLARELDLDTGAIHDLLATDRRAKYETFGATQLLIATMITIDHDTAAVTLQPISMVVTDRVLICLAAPAAATATARSLAASDDHLATGGVAEALQSLVKLAVQSQADAIEWLETASDELSAALFDERPLDKGEQLWAFKLRRALTQVRRVTEPTLDLLTDLTQADDHDRVLARRWTLLAERQERVVHASDALRDALASVFDTSLALSNQRMNADMRRLTGWAAIIAVPTLISGFAGMNVSIPLDGTPAGLWLYLVIMVVTGIVLFILFRRHDWI
jgi:magnesium transporter